MNKRNFGLTLTAMIIAANIIIPIRFSAKVSSKLGTAGFKFSKAGLLDGMTQEAKAETAESVQNIYHIKNK